MTIKTKLFIGLRLDSIRAYQKFIEENQLIEIIAVNVLENDNILLTYKD